MPKVRSNGAQRWAQRTAAAAGDYQAGVQNPRQSWQQATVAAADAHKAATMKALNEGRFSKGVTKAGDAKWQRGAAGKGVDRFQSGAQAGQQDYESGVAPFLAVIERTALPPRGPKGDPNNIKRVAVLAAALHGAKVGSVSLLLAIALACASVVATVAGVIVHNKTGVVASGGDVSGMLIPARQGMSSTGRTAVGVTVALVVIVCCFGAALDTVSASATAAAAAGTAMAAVAGDSLVIRNSPQDVPPLIIDTWVKSQTSGFFQFTHPSGHDVQRDFRARHVAAAVLPLFAEGFAEVVQPQENLTLTLGEGAVAGDIGLAHFLLWYPELKGVKLNSIDLAGLESRMVNYLTIEDTTTATVGGAYSGARAINAASDLLRADTEYALLGAHIGANCGALTVRGVDTGNLRVAIPGAAGRPDLTADWFVYLSQQWALPLIPVFNSANRAGIFIENVQDENLAAVPFALVLAQLSPA